MIIIAETLQRFFIPCNNNWLSRGCRGDVTTMKSNPITRILTVFLFWMVLAVPCSGQVWLLPWYLKASAEQTKLEFYGILKDQDGSPVAGARVDYTIRYVGLLMPMQSERHVWTDKDGRFSIRGGRIGQLYIDSFELAGYEYKRDGQKGFTFLKTERTCHKADRDKPVEYRVRRKNPEAVYLLDISTMYGLKLRIGTDAMEEWCGLDICRGAQLDKEWLAREIGGAMAGRHPGLGLTVPGYWLDREIPDITLSNADLEMYGRLDLEHHVWKVTIMANGELSGLQFSNQELFEAPADGYVKKLTMEWPVMESEDGLEAFPKYLYARLGPPGYYFRGKITNVTLSDHGFGFVIREAMLNPYGGRCLEMLKFVDIGSEERRAIDHEAYRAWRKGKLAERPDFEKLIKEGLLVY